jgi:hypothetical protein
MDVEITVKVGGQLVKRHVQTVDGTLEQMEEAIHVLTRRVAADALQASVDQVAGPRPLFRKPAGNGGTGATGRGPSSDSPGR